LKDGNVKAKDRGHNHDQTSQMVNDRLTIVPVVLSGTVAITQYPVLDMVAGRCRLIA
jgi:hypothetical protein